jgi:rhodanese-related sulfurtransferase
MKYRTPITRLIGRLFAAGLLSISFAGFAADPFDDVFDTDNPLVKITPELASLEVNHYGTPVIIMRHQDPAHTIDAPYDLTSRECPPFCIMPMSIAPGVETIGELEMIEYLSRVSSGEEGVLVIDSRVEGQASRNTIPGSINIPYTQLNSETAMPAEIAEVLALEFNAIPNEGLWSFSAAKTLVLFCNGPWCGQSPANISALVAMGYPSHKIKWYRGGMQAWEQFGLTTVGR